MHMLKSNRCQSIPGLTTVNMAHANNAQRDKQGGATVDREHFYKLRAVEIEEKLKDLLSADVDMEQLKSLCCIQLDNIEIDIDHGGLASSATFFQPSPPIDEGLKKILSRHWFNLPPGEAPRIYPEYRGGWFATPWDEVEDLQNDELQIDRFGGTAWQCIEYV